MFLLASMKPVTGTNCENCSESQSWMYTKKID